MWCHTIFFHSNFIIFNLFLASTLTLVQCRTPDETSAPPTPTDIYQILSPPSSPAVEATTRSDQSYNPNNINNKINYNNKIDGLNQIEENDHKGSSTATLPLMTSSSSGCFYRGPEDCPTDKCRCKQLEGYSSAVICCDVTEFFLKEGLSCASKFKT